jgi:2-dehydropantoate 2-reductase
MHVLILGAGAMGSFIGAKLSTTSATVDLLTMDQSHAESIRRHGLVIDEPDGSAQVYRLPVFDRAKDLTRKPDLVIVLVKNFATGDAVRSIQSVVTPQTVFLTLQNGVGNYERLAEVVAEKQILVGTTAQASTLLAPGRLHHGGNGMTFIGEFRAAPSPRVADLVEKFNQAGLNASAGENMERRIWQKLVMNTATNAITALAHLPIGAIVDNQAARELSRETVAEALRVAKAQNIEVGDDFFDKVVITTCRAIATHTTSMSQDMAHKRRTEIDSINGAIVDYGKKLGIPTPVNWALVSLVRAYEADKK